MTSTTSDPAEGVIGRDVVNPPIVESASWRDGTSRQRRRLRVATIGSRGFPGQRAGVERVLESVCPRLVATGRIDMRVYCPDWLEYEGDTYEGVELCRVGGFRTKYGDTITRSLLATLKELRSDSDIVHYHSVGSAPFAILPRLFGKRVALTVHALDWQRSKWSGVGKWYLRFAEWTSMHFPHTTLVVSQELKDNLERRYRGRTVTFIPNGAEQHEERPIDEIAQFGLEAGKFILFVGRLVPEKGAHLLVEAFHRLPREHDLKLAIVGPAWYEADYTQSLHELAGDDDRIVFVGEADDDRLAELYSNCASFVLPSDVEGMSLSLLDAMAYGTAIVTSSIPQNANLVADAGLIFDAGDVDALHESLHRVVSNPALAERLRVAASERAARDEFDWDRIAWQWIRAYDDLVDS